jgi:hypothetical protein
MTINLSDNNPRVSYSVAQGVTQSSFTVSFEFFDDDDLNVYVDGTLKTLTTDYTVTGGDGSTGTVTMSVTGATGGSTVVITRDIDLERTTDFPSSGPFNIGSLNTELDRIIAITADLEDLAGRGVKLADFDTQAALTLPLASERGNKVLAFNAAGDTLVSQELGTFKGDWAASTAYVERDLVKDTTTNNVFIVTSAHTSSGSLPLTTNTNSAKYEKIIDITNPPGDVTFGGSITTSSSVTAGSFVIGSADINENDLEAIDSVTAGTVAASKAVVVDVNKDISSFRNLTATGDITFGGLSDGTITVTAFVDEDNMASDSATLVPTQQSVKAYVDAQVATADTLTEILGNGNTTSGANIQMTTTDELQFRDTALKISSSADGQLDIDADTEVEITAPTVDINASTEVNISGAAKIGGTLNIDTINELTTDAGTTINSTFIGNNKIGIGTSVVGDTQVAIKGSAAKLRLESLTAGNHNWDIGVSTTSLRIYHQATGQNPFWIDSTDNVGIGTISPSTKLDVNGTVTATGGAFTGDVSFGDNDKAIFGAGSDLQIYHDGSASYIDDQGEGPLKIKATDFRIKNAADTKNYLRADDGGAVSVYYDNAQKLATTSTGVDITGTLTSDGLTVDGNVSVGSTGASDRQIYMGSVGNLYGALNTDGASGNFNITSGHATTGGTALQFYTANSGSEIRRTRIDTNGDISFYEDTGTTPKFIWDASAESLGIGTSSPSHTISLESAYPYISFNETDQSQKWVIGGASGNFVIYDDTDAATRLAVDGSGNVGIGTTSPQQDVHVQSTGSATVMAERTGPNAGLIGIYGSNNPALVWGGNTDVLRFAQVDDTSLTNFTERMRIDSSGNLLVGKTSATNFGSTAGFEVLSDGRILSTVSGDQALALSRTSSDGYIAEFYKDTTFVGSINSRGGVVSSIVLDPRTGGGGLGATGPGSLCATNNTGASTTDNVLDLGHSGARWKDVYVGGGVYLGGTGSANKLDDYEEGTWTPAITGASTNPSVTYTNAFGVYVKTGEMVHVSFKINTASFSGGSGAMLISNLPFASYSANSLYRMIGVIAFSRDIPNNGGPLLINGGSNLTEFNIYRNTNSDDFDTALLVTDVTSGTVTLHGSLTYRSQ